MIAALFLQRCSLMYFKAVALLKQLVYQGGTSTKQIVSPVDYITKALPRQSLDQSIYIEAVGPIRRLVYQNGCSTQAVTPPSKRFFIFVRDTLPRRSLHQIDYSIERAVSLKNYHRGDNFFCAFALLGVRCTLCLFYYSCCSG